MPVSSSASPYSHPSSPANDVAQISFPDLWPFGRKPPCPNPRNFNSSAMNLAAQAQHFADVANNAAINGGPDAGQVIRANIHNMETEVKELKKLVDRFRDDWNRCGNEERLPDLFFDVQAELRLAQDTLDELKNSIANDEMSGIEINLEGIKTILGGLYLLFNNSLSDPVWGI
jgi:hypothetical protein